MENIGQYVVLPLYALSLYGLVGLLKKWHGSSEAKVKLTPLEAVGITLQLYFLTQILAGIVLYAFASARGMKPDQIVDWLTNSNMAQFGLIAVIESLTLYLLYWFLKRRQADFKTIGLVRRPQWRDLGYIGGGFLAYVMLYGVAASVLDSIAPAVDQDQKQQIGFSNPRGYELPFIFVSLAVLPPIAEELMVRGFLYTGLKSKLTKFWAVFITCALFAVAHLQAGNGEPLLWIAAVDTFVLSAVLIYLREKTGSLWASIGLHMLKNSVAFVSIFILHLA